MDRGDERNGRGLDRLGNNSYDNSTGEEGAKHTVYMAGGATVGVGLGERPDNSPNNSDPLHIDIHRP